MKLKPCPFCGDEMGVDRSDTILHREQGKCPVGIVGWPIEQAGRWNKRAPAKEQS